MAAGLEVAEAGHPLTPEALQAGQEFIEAELQRAVGDARVLAEEALDAGGGGGGLDPRLQSACSEQQSHGLGDQLLLARRGRRGHPGAGEAEAAGEVALQAPQVVGEVAAVAGGFELGEEAVAESRPGGAHGQAHRLAGQLLGEVSAGLPGDGRDRGRIGRFQTEVGHGFGEAGEEARHRPPEVGREVVSRLARREQRVGRAQARQAAGLDLPGGACGLDGRVGLDGRAGLDGVRAGVRFRLGVPVGRTGIGPLAVEGPEQGARGARPRPEAQQVGAGEQGEQPLQEEGGVVIVEAALVALLVALGGVGAHGLREVAWTGIAEAGERQAGVLRQAGFGGGEDLRRQGLAAVDLRRLRDQALLPVGPGGLELGVLDRLEEVGAGQVEGEAAAARHQGQLERLAVDAEAVAAEPEDGVAVLEQVAAVAQRPRRLLARGLEPALDLVGAHRVADFAQAGRDVAQLGHHRVGGEEGVELVGGRELQRAAAEPQEDPAGCLGEGAGAALALVEQRLLAGGEGLEGLLALLGEPREQLLELAETALQLLELEHQLGELGVAGFRRVGEGERPGDRLAEELELGAELGQALFVEQLLAMPGEQGAHPVDPPEGLGERLQDGGAHRGVVDRQGADHLGEQLEPRAQLRDRLAGRLGLGDGRRPRHLGLQLGQPAVDRCKSLGRAQQLDRRGGDRVEVGRRPASPARRGGAGRRSAARAG